MLSAGFPQSAQLDMKESRAVNVYITKQFQIQKDKVFHNPVILMKPMLSWPFCSEGDTSDYTDLHVNPLFSSSLPMVSPPKAAI